MKRKSIAIICVATLLAAFAGGIFWFTRSPEKTISIDERNFPDENFRAYVSDFFDRDDDGMLDRSEIRAAQICTPKGLEICSLKGIEWLTDLEYLDCSNNELESLDLGKNTKTEQKKVAVIYDTLAEVLFEKKNPIGESLVFPVYELNEELGAMEVAYYQDLKVIGVIRAPQRAEAYFDDKDIGAGEELNVCFPVYIPLSLKIDKDEPDSRIMRVTAYSNKEEYSETAERIERIAAGYREAEYRVDSYFSLYAAAKDELTTARDGIFILAFAMLIISGIAIANTMFFSVKERINEIGIRKSIGADDYDILIQFVFEGAVYGIFSGIIGVLMCMVFDPIIYLVLIKRAIWLPGVPLCFEYSVVCLAVSIAVLISTLASVIPAIYASRIKIAEAIRFE